LDSLGPFRLVAQHQHRLAERRRLFLHTARIRQQQIGAAHEVDKRHIVEGRDQEDIGALAQDALHRLPHVGVRMHGVDDLHVGARCQIGQRVGDFLEPFAETLPAVRGGDDQLALRIELPPVAALEAPVLQPVANVQHGVDAGVSGDRDTVLAYAFGAEIARGALGGCEVQRGEPRREQPVHFLRERLVDIESSQPRLDVPHGDALVERRQGAAERGGRVALHQDHIRLLGVQNRFHAREDARRRLKQRLAGEHDVEIIIGVDVEGGQHLVQHLAMLAGDAHPGVELLRMPLHVKDDGRKIDGFRPCAEDE